MSALKVCKARGSERPSHAHQRRTQIMSETLGDRAHARDQRFVLIKYFIERHGQGAHGIQTLLRRRARPSVRA